MIEQGSAEWHQLRCGKATASRIADIMRNGRGGKPSASRERYKGELVAERLTGTVAPSFKSADMQWGNDTEDEARTAYAFYTSTKPEPIDFVIHPTIPMSGASPDRLVGDDGLLEIKCPATHTHINYLLGASIDADYLTQIQWQLACTERKWVDWVSYDPRLPEEMRLLVYRVERDETRIHDLEFAVTKFLEEVDRTVAELTAKFGTPEAA